MTEGHEGPTALRGIWAARGETAADVPSGGKVCKNMRTIGFGGVTEDGSTAGPIDDEQRAAWRARLVREGKIVPARSPCARCSRGS